MIYIANHVLLFVERILFWKRILKTKSYELLKYMMLRLPSLLSFSFLEGEIIGNPVPFLGWNVQINLLLLLVTVLVYNNYSRCYHLWSVPTPSILSFISCIEIEHNRPRTDSWGISKMTVWLSDLLVSVWTIYFLSLSYGNFKSS